MSNFTLISALILLYVVTQMMNDYHNRDLRNEDNHEVSAVYMIFIYTFFWVIQWCCWLILLFVYAIDGREGYLCSLIHVDRDTWQLPINPKALDDHDNSLVIFSGQFPDLPTIELLQQASIMAACTDFQLVDDTNVDASQFGTHYTFAPDAIDTIRITSRYYWFRAELGMIFAVLPLLVLLLPLLRKKFWRKWCRCLVSQSVHQNPLLPDANAPPYENANANANENPNPAIVVVNPAADAAADGLQDPAAAVAAAAGAAAPRNPAPVGEQDGFARQGPGAAAASASAAASAAAAVTSDEARTDRIASEQENILASIQTSVPMAAAALVN